MNRHTVSVGWKMTERHTVLVGVKMVRCQVAHSYCKTLHLLLVVSHTGDRDDSHSSENPPDVLVISMVAAIQAIPFANFSTCLIQTPTIT